MCVMPQPRLERITRALCLILNSLFFLLSLLLITFVCLAAINAPSPNISPQPLNSYPQYIITIGLIASYSVCLFLLDIFGLVSLCVPGSFLLSLDLMKDSTEGTELCWAHKENPFES
ncbi:hypothetical protein KIN20_000017 [Parelaphostrongylus tenuis]|uniref:Uncharacterized protein n=1 Tax=Parelaphostrongylus tenuis TaxID=148309 RepID=A0AAD5QDH5_PARTN|nr:hypothetical protein KIN20_000017 [Parelaphostrongylus tenuis]